MSYEEVKEKVLHIVGEIKEDFDVSALYDRTDELIEIETVFLKSLPDG